MERNVREKKWRGGSESNKEWGETCKCGRRRKEKKIGEEGERKMKIKKI